MAVAFVQTIGKGKRDSTNTTCVVTVPAGGVALGNTVAVEVGWNTTTDPSSVADSKGNTYTQAVVVQDTHTSTKRVAIYTAPVTSALVSGDTITATWATGPSRSVMIAQEFSGVLTASSPVDVTASNGSASASTLDAGSVATNQAAEGWLVATLQGITTNTSFTLTADGSFTGADTQSNAAASVNLGLGFEYQIVAATGTMHPAPTSSLTTPYTAACVALKAGAAVPVNTVAPALSGNKYTGQTLTCSTGTWTGTGSITYAYQWQKDTVDIGGTTANTHVLVSGDETHSIRCVVTATDTNGSASANSNAIVGGPSYVATSVLREEWCDFAFVAYTPGVTVLAPPITLVRIAPGSNASDRYPSWTDVSSLVRSFTYTRGRQTELDQAEVGTASVVFDNKSRVLDPSYTAGPFYPHLLPNMQVSIQASYGSIVYDLFRGYVERFTTSYTGPNYAETTLECVDGMASLSNVTITGTFDQQTTGERVLAVLGAAGWPTTTTPSGWTLGTDTLGVTSTLGATIPVNIIDTGRATVAETTILATDEKGAVTHIQEVVDSEPGRFFFDGANVAVFQDRSHVVPVPDTPVLTLTDDPADTTGIPYRDVVVNYEIDKIHNDIQLQAIDGTVTAAFDSPSISRYWRRTLSRQTQLRAYDSDLYQQAGWLLRQSKDPLLRILQVSVDAYNTTTFRALHPLGLGDHITVTRTPPGLTAERLQQDSVIERLTVTAVPGPVWRFVYELSSLGTEPAPWLLGQAALGTSTTLVFA